MRDRFEYKNTSKRSVYNRARKSILQKEGKIKCPVCRYHRGENVKSQDTRQRAHWKKYGYSISWKRLRGRQWK